jgi:hypothetical protein
VIDGSLYYTVSNSLDSDWHPPTDMLEYLFGLALQFETATVPGETIHINQHAVRRHSDGLYLPAGLLIDKTEPKYVVDVLRALAWIGRGRLRGCSFSTGASELLVHDLSSMRAGIDQLAEDARNQAREAAMSLTKDAEKAAELIEKVRSDNSQTVSEKISRLYEAMRLAGQARAPMLHAVAAGMTARLCAENNDPQAALRLGLPAVKALREHGLALEATRLEHALPSCTAIPLGASVAGDMGTSTDAWDHPPVKGDTNEAIEALVGREDTERERERDWIMAIKEKVTTAAVSTGTGALDAFKEGLAISGSQQVSDKLVALFHAKLGHNIPMASSPLGQQFERLAIPAVVHMLAGLMPEKIPGAEIVQKTCMRAITGVAKDDGDALIEAALPMFAEIVKIGTTDGFDLVSMMASGAQVEQIGVGTESKALAQQSRAGALTEALQRQLEAAEEGEEVVISIKKGKTKKNGKAQAAEEDHGVVPPEPTRS